MNCNQQQWSDSTTGMTTQETEENLSKIWERAKEPGNIVISIVTGNWILMGRNMDSLHVCARGEGHLAFKEQVCKNSNYIIVVSPLPKLLAVDDPNLLNQVAPYKTYQSFLVSNDNRRVSLLTTRRERGSQSPFYNLSLRLEGRAKLPQEERNYELWSGTPIFEPIGDAKAVQEEEIPHHYILPHFEEFYGYQNPF